MVLVVGALLFDALSDLLRIGSWQFVAAGVVLGLVAMAFGHWGTGFAIVGFTAVATFARF